MTNREAAEYLDKYVMNVAPYGKWKEVVELAISALQEQEEKTQLSAEGTTSDCISRQAAIALANSLKDDLPDDERIADTVMAHNEGILEYQTKLSLLPSAQPEMNFDEWCTDCKEYDHEKHCCPRWNRVIRQTLKDAQPEIIRCKDCMHRGEKPIADGRYWCSIHMAYMYYCSDAERRTDD